MRDYTVDNTIRERVMTAFDPKCEKVFTTPKTYASER